jgi:hypothetical protein
MAIAFAALLARLRTFQETLLGLLARAILASGFVEIDGVLLHEREAVALVEDRASIDCVLREDERRSD